MILSMLGSKGGALLVAVGVCALFLGVSKWRHRSGQPEPARSQRLEISRPTASGTLLARVQEHAVARADDVRSDRLQPGAKGESYDDIGNLYRRRATPDPFPENGGASPDAFSDNSSVAPVSDVTGLRIHGRRPAESSSAPSKWENSLSAVLPSGLKAKLATPASTNPGAEKPKAPTRFVPFGRLIKAELVITLESTQDEMPLIGVVTEPVYNNGHLVIPAGTELHSTARPDRIRDRIVSTAIWRLVFPREGLKPNGRQLVFDGIALDREDRDSNGLTWGLTDGSYGLRGRAIHHHQTAESLMLFAAEAIKAGSSTLMDRQQTLLGTQVEENARNAGLAGTQAVLSHYAEGIAKELERNGTYIQVPAGKEFYVYPRQVIDSDRADIPDNIAKVE